MDGRYGRKRPVGVQHEDPAVYPFQLLKREALEVTPVAGMDRPPHWIEAPKPPSIVLNSTSPSPIHERVSIILARELSEACSVGS